MKNVEGNYVIQVAYTSDRTLSSYDNVLNQMVFKPGNVNERQTYNLHPRAYYHKGSELLMPYSFAANDAVTIYVIDNKIVEMEKH